MTGNERQIAELLRMIDDTDRTGGNLDSELQRKLVDTLETCLLERVRLKRFTRILQELLGGNARHREILSEDRFDAVMEKGLTALTDNEVVELALNPFALWDVHDGVYRDWPEYWTRRLPSSEELLKCDDDSDASLDRDSRSPSVGWEDFGMVSDAAESLTASHLQGAVHAYTLGHGKTQWLDLQAQSAEGWRSVGRISATSCSLDKRGLGSQPLAIALSSTGRRSANARFIPVGERLRELGLDREFPWVECVKVYKVGDNLSTGTATFYATVVEDYPKSSHIGQLRIDMISRSGERNVVVLSSTKRHSRFQKKSFPRDFTGLHFDVFVEDIPHG